MDNEHSSKMKYLLMPDSFKGTMDAIEVCDIMQKAILQCEPEAEARSVPIADGGEGTVDCFLHAFGGEKIPVKVTGPYGEQIQAFYGKMDDTAVIEMAAASGFLLSHQGRKDPSSATTYGVGELTRHAIETGCRKIILGLGGSCTNDGGAGMAAALGTRFYKADGTGFVPTGKTLHEIKRIDTENMRPILKGTSIEVMCDIDNPLYGPRGAAYMFAPQKGADDAMVKLLDDNLRAYAKIIEENLGIQVAQLPGAGAAGGMGAGVCAFFDAKLKQGIDVMLDFLQFEKLLKEYRTIFTGEGQLDVQSLGGKAVIGISRRAMKENVPVIAVVGRVKGDISNIYQLGITKVFETTTRPYRDDQELLRHCQKDLFEAMIRILSES